MYIGHGRLCVCLSVHRRIPTLLHGPGHSCHALTWRSHGHSLAAYLWRHLR